MAETTLPYMAAYGTITKALERIKEASTPGQFTQDFLSTKLGMKGGSPKPIIPFLKRTGMLASDGSPTDLYRRFRNDALTGAAAAEALRIGYAPLYEINEYVHDVSEKDLKGIVVQHTGAEPGSSTVKSIVGSFKALKSFATFDEEAAGDQEDAIDRAEELVGESVDAGGPRAALNLGYTINLHLPATSDIAVFNAIFKSLKEHLL